MYGTKSTHAQTHTAHISFYTNVSMTSMIAALSVAALPVLTL